MSHQICRNRLLWAGPGGSRQNSLQHVPGGRAAEEVGRQAGSLEWLGVGGESPGDLPRGEQAWAPSRVDLGRV